MNGGNLKKAELQLKNAIQIDPKYADAYFLLGQVAMKKGSYQQAYKYFNQAVELAPGNLEAQVSLGRLILMRGDMERAQEKVTLVLKADPRHTGGQLLCGSILVARKEWSTLAPLGEGLIAGGVTRPDLYLMLATARSGLKDTAGAELALLKGAQLNPTDSAIQRTLADLYAVKGRVDAAAEHIRHLMELEPANYSYGITLAELYRNCDRPSEANDILTRLAAANQTNEECLVAIAGFYLSHRLNLDAEKLLKNGIVSTPRSYLLRFALSELYIDTDRGEEALAVLKECLALDKKVNKPESIQTRNLLARFCFQRGELREAERYLGEILKVNPSNIDATYLKGCVSLQKKDVVAAISAFRSLINSRPHDADGYLFLADAHMLNRDTKLAEENLQLAEQIEPDSLRVVRALARFSAAENRFRAGEERLQQFLIKHPENSDARVELGELYGLGGNLRRAGEEFAAAKRRAPNAAAPYLRMSELYTRQGNLTRAITELEMVAGRISPGNIPAALTLANLYVRTANPAKARQTFEKLVSRCPGEWHVKNDYACFLADNGTSKQDFETAWTLAKDAAVQQPDDPLVQDTLGWAEYRRGNIATALDILHKAGNLATGNQTVEYHLGMVCLSASKKEEARIHLNRSLAGGNFPGKQQAAEALKRL